MNEKLEKIKAALRLTLELDAKAPVGPLEFINVTHANPKQSTPDHDVGNIRGAGMVGIAHHVHRSSFDFIAHARTYAPLQARALLDDIDVFEVMASRKACQYDSDRNSSDSHSFCLECQRSGPYGSEPPHLHECSVSRAQKRLETICREWPE